MCESRLWLKLPHGQISWAPLDDQLEWVEVTRAPELDVEQSVWTAAVELHAALRGRGTMPGTCWRPAACRGWRHPVLGVGFAVLAVDRLDVLDALGGITDHEWGPARRYLARAALGDRVDGEQHLHYPSSLDNRSAPHVFAPATAET